MNYWKIFFQVVAVLMFVSPLRICRRAVLLYVGAVREMMRWRLAGRLSGDMPTEPAGFKVFQPDY